MVFVIVFLLSGILGWAFDTTYRSMLVGRYAPGTYIPFFATCFGVAGTMIFFIFTHVPSLYAQIILGTLVAILVEFISGVFCITVYKRRLWDYSGRFLNVFGHIDFLHSFYWFTLVLISDVIYRSFSGQ